MTYIIPTLFIKYTNRVANFFSIHIFHLAVVEMCLVTNNVHCLCFKCLD